MRPASTWASRKRVTIDPMPELILFGRPECPDCKEAKRILDALGIPYTFRVIDDLLDAHEGWRGDGSWDVLVAYSMNENRLPIVKSHGVYCGFPEALARLKARSACQSVLRDRTFEQANPNGCTTIGCGNLRRGETSPC